MKIRVVFDETPPWVPDDTYVLVTGDLDDTQTRKILDEIDAWILRSLHEMGVLRTAG